MKKKSICLLVLVCLLMVFLSVVQIVVSSKLSTAGTTLSKIDSSLQAYQTENSVLREKIYDASSLTTVASKAAAMGFVEQKTVVTLEGPLPLAIK